jgi:hypothetical protein
MPFVPRKAHGEAGFTGRSGVCLTLDGGECRHHLPPIASESADLDRIAAAA